MVMNNKLALPHTRTSEDQKEHMEALNDFINLIEKKQF